MRIRVMNYTVNAVVSKRERDTFGYDYASVQSLQNREIERERKRTTVSDKLLDETLDHETKRQALESDAVSRFDYGLYPFGKTPVRHWHPESAEGMEAFN